jgi:hypothetical protein
MNDNQQLKILLHDAESVCNQKLFDVIDRFGDAHPDVIVIHQDLNRVFGTFRRLEIWAFPIEYDEQNLVKLTLRVDDVNPESSFDFFDAANKLIAALKEDIIQEALDNLDTIDLSEFNLRALDALSFVRKKIAERKRFFKRQGIDLKNDSDFKEKDNLRISLMREYRAMLRLDEIQATDRDINRMKKIGSGMQGSTGIDKFIFYHDELIIFLDRVVPTHA